MFLGLLPQFIINWGEGRGGEGLLLVGHIGGNVNSDPVIAWTFMGIFLCFPVIPQFSKGPLSLPFFTGSLRKADSRAKALAEGSV